MITSEASSNANETILIVDDAPENIEILNSQLQNFNRKAAPNGEIAITIAKKSLPDLILLDLVMPGLDGFDVITKLKEEDSTRDIPIIMITAKSDSDSIVKALSLGAVDYIRKPFNPEEVLLRINQQITIIRQKKMLLNLNAELDQKVKLRTQQLSEANHRLEKMNQQIIELDESKNEFLKLISHELRTPLNGIIGSTYLLSMNQEADDEHKEYLEMLKTSVDRLENFTYKALLITDFRLNPTLTLSELSISDLVKLIEHQTNESFPQSTVQSQLLFSDQLIRANHEYIQKAVKEILENVKVHASNTPLTPLITIIQNTESLQIIVRDYGPSFSEKALNNLFQPFGEGAKHADNKTGLGLAIAKHIVDAHNGELIISNANPGAEVTIKLQL
ncbi:MAG: hybrid sensor histidine kinase/response regulator [Sphingobacteriia bacterium]|nr:hybrid sensor histidine kinase/response regulator [Sphingobacteriia bacterium]